MKPEQQKALNAAATELLRKVDSKTPEEFFKLYKDDSTKEAVTISEKKLLEEALSTLKSKHLDGMSIQLNDEEITLLHKYTGVKFTKAGDITDFERNSPIVDKKKLPSSQSLLGNVTLFSNDLKDFSDKQYEDIQKTLQKFNKNEKPLLKKQQALLNQYIIKCLTLPPLQTVITNYTHQNLPNEDLDKEKQRTINRLLEKLEKMFKERFLLKAEEINSIFNELYKYIGIKYQFNRKTGTINVVKIKYNAPAFVEELKKDPILEDAEKHSIYVITEEEKTDLLPKRTNKSPEQERKPPLGQGSFGVVHRSFTDKPIALKKIKLNKENKELIANEILILKQLGLNPITLEIGNNMYIGIPLFPGKTIEAKDFEEQSLDTKLKVATSIVLDLAKKHAQGIWHRDIKGANVITNALHISEEQQPETNIFDFNTSEILSNLGTKTITLAGTPGYIAPEFGGIFTNAQYKEKPTEADYLASDIYSLGKLFMYDMGLYNLGIVYEMIDPDYKKRPPIGDVVIALNRYSEHKIDIAKQELAIKEMPSTNPQELDAKILAIDRLLTQHNICSESYYETLLKVLEIGTPEQLKIMINNPVFNNLYVITIIGMGVLLKAPYENKIQELLKICTNKTPPAAECAWLILENLIKLIKEQGLEIWVAKQHLNNYTTFLVDAGLSLGKFNTGTSDLELLKELGITAPTQTQKLEALSKEFIDTQAHTPDSNSPLPSPRSGDSSDNSVGYPESPRSSTSNDILKVEDLTTTDSTIAMPQQKKGKTG